MGANNGKLYGSEGKCLYLTLFYALYLNSVQEKKMFFSPVWCPLSSNVPNLNLFLLVSLTFIYFRRLCVEAIFCSHINIKDLGKIKKDLKKREIGL